MINSGLNKLLENKKRFDYLRESAKRTETPEVAEELPVSLLNATQTKGNGTLSEDKPQADIQLEETTPGVTFSPLEEPTRPEFLQPKPIKLTDTIAEPTSTRVAQQEPYTPPDERLTKAVEEEGSKPFEIFGKPTGMTKSQQSGLAKLEELAKERKKPLFQKAVESVYNALEHSRQTIQRGLEEGNVADVGLGTVSAGLQTIMTPMNFFTPAGQKMGVEIGGLIGNEKLGQHVGEFLPFLTMPNPIAFYAASKGSEVATDEVMKVVNDTDLSDVNKERILSAVGLGSFILTHRLIAGGIKKIKEPDLKAWLDSEIEKTSSENLEKSTLGKEDIDQAVLNELNPKQEQGLTTTQKSRIELKPEEELKIKGGGNAVPKQSTTEIPIQPTPGSSKEVRRGDTEGNIQKPSTAQEKISTEETGGKVETVSKSVSKDVSLTPPKESEIKETETDKQKPTQKLTPAEPLTPEGGEVKTEKQAKEIYQMTLKEKSELPYYKETAEKFPKQFRDDQKRLIQEAINKKFKIPDEVLEDFPELKSMIKSSPPPSETKVGKQAWEMSEGEKQKLRDEYNVLLEKNYKKDGTLKAKHNPDEVKRMEEMRKFANEYKNKENQFRDEQGQAKARDLLKQAKLTEGETISVGYGNGVSVNGELVAGRDGKIYIKGTDVTDKIIKNYIGEKSSKVGTEKVETNLAELQKQTKELIERSKQDPGKAYVTNEVEIDGKKYLFIDDGNQHGKIETILDEKIGKHKTLSTGWTVNGEYLTDAKEVIKKQKGDTDNNKSEAVRLFKLNKSDREVGLALKVEPSKVRKWREEFEKTQKPEIPPTEKIKKPSVVKEKQRPSIPPSEARKEVKLEVKEKPQAIEQKSEKIIEKTEDAYDKLMEERKIKSDKVAKQNFDNAKNYLLDEVKKLKDRIFNEVVDKDESITDAGRNLFQELINKGESKDTNNELIKVNELISERGKESYWGKVLDGYKLPGEIKINIPNDGTVTLNDPSLQYLFELEKNIKQMLRYDKKVSLTVPMPKKIKQSYADIDLEKFDSKEEYLKKITEELKDTEENLQTSRKGKSKELTGLFENDVKNLKEQLSAGEKLNWDEVLSDRIEGLQKTNEYMQYQVERINDLLSGKSSIDEFGSPLSKAEAKNFRAERSDYNNKIKENQAEIERLRGIGQVKSEKPVNERTNEEIHKARALILKRMPKPASEMTWEEYKPYGIELVKQSSWGQPHSWTERQAKTEWEFAQTKGKSEKPTEETKPKISEEKVEAPKEKPRIISEDAYKKAKENLTKNLGNLSAGIDPTHLKDLTTVGAYHFENGIRDFASWSKKMVEEFGDKIRERLREIWDEVNKKIPKSEEQKTGETKVRGLAKSTEADAIASGIVDKIQGLPTYEVRPNDPQIKVAADIIANDLERAKRIEFGLEKPPDNMLPGFIHTGLKDYAIERDDIDLMMKLATSPYLSEQGTIAGQFIQALGRHELFDPVDAIKEVTKGREDTPANRRIKIVKEGLEKEIQRLENKLKLKEEEIEKISAERTIKKIKREVDYERRREKRAVTKEQIKEHRSKLYTELYKETANLNVAVPLSTKAIKILGEIAKDYVVEGLTDATGIVDAIHMEVKDKIEGITKQDIRKAISGYGRSTQKTKSELQKTIQDLKQQMETISKLEDLEAGKLPIKRPVTRTSPSEHLKSLKAELKQKLKESGIAEEEKLSKAKEKIKKQIKEFDEKITKGEYSEIERGTAPIDKEKTDLQKKLQETRDKWKSIQEVNVGKKITFEEASKINELSKIAVKAKEKMENSPRRELGKPATEEELAYGHARVAFGEYIDELKSEANKMTWKEFKASPMGNIARGLSHLPGMTKSLKATFDNSGLFNQNITVLFTHPVIWQRNALKSFQDIWNVMGDKNVMAEINADKVSRPNYEYYKEDKLAIGTVEEAFPDSKLVEKIPYLGRVHKAANTAFTGLAYRNRMDVYDLLAEHAKNLGYEQPTGLGIGSLVNSLTGRGSLGRFERGADVFNVMMFAPRFLKSHIDVLVTPFRFGSEKYSPFARKEAAKNLLKIIGGISAITVAANAVKPGSVETDPRSTDFMKIRIGDTRFNFTGGLGALAVLATKLILTLTNQVGLTNIPQIKTASGEYKKLNTGEFNSQTGFDVLVNFMRGKLSPVASLGTQWLMGQTFSGDRLTLKNQLANLAVPLPITNYNELVNNPKSADLIGAIIADALGIFTNTYSDDPDVKKIKRDLLRADEEKFGDEAIDNFYEAVNNAKNNGLITQEQYDDYKQQFEELQKTAPLAPETEEGAVQSPRSGRPGGRPR